MHTNIKSFLGWTETKIFKVFHAWDQNGQRSCLKFVPKIQISSKNVSLLSNNVLIRVEWNQQNVLPSFLWWLNFSLSTRIQVKYSSKYSVSHRPWLTSFFRGKRENGCFVENFCWSSIDWWCSCSGIVNQSMFSNYHEKWKLGKQSWTNIPPVYWR